MKAAWLGPLVLSILACGGGAAGPRGSENLSGMTTPSGGAGVISGVSGSAGASGAAPGVSGTGGSPGAGGAVGGGGLMAGGSGGLGTAGSGPAGHPSQRTVAYLPSYRGALANWASRIDASQLSYVNLCFADVAANGSVSYPDTGLDAFVAAVHAKGVKVCLAIGGATVIDTGGVYATVLQDGQRDAFVNQLGQFAVDHQLDCIDVDLEGNGVNQYHQAFVTSLATKLHAASKELTTAVSSWFGDKITDAAIQAFDFVNVMAYDLHNPGGSAEPVQSSSIEEATKEVDYWVGRGLPKNKAVFGVPFYGYRWTGAKVEALTYADILAQSPSAATQDKLDLAGSTVYLNSRTTIQAKAARAKSYGGIMVWELGQDAAGDASLLKAIAEAGK